MPELPDPSEIRVAMGVYEFLQEQVAEMEARYEISPASPHRLLMPVNEQLVMAGSLVAEARVSIRERERERARKPGRSPAHDPWSHQAQPGAPSRQSLMATRLGLVAARAIYAASRLAPPHWDSPSQEALNTSFSLARQLGAEGAFADDPEGYYLRVLERAGLLIEHLYCFDQAAEGDPVALEWARDSYGSLQDMGGSFALSLIGVAACATEACVRLSDHAFVPAPLIDQPR